MSSQSEDYLQKELKSCRYQLSHAERRVTSACESRDALVIKLENATDKMAELERTLEVNRHQREVLANEIATKEVDLAALDKDRSALEVSLSIARMNLGKMTEKLAKVELEAEAHAKSTSLVEAALVKERENSSKLQKDIDAMALKQSNLRRKLNDSKDTVFNLEKEAQVAVVQIRTLEAKLAATESELQRAKTEAAESRKAKQAYKDAINDTQNTKKELRHLGMELLREQGTLEEQAVQHKAQALVRAQRAERKVNAEEGSSGLVDAELLFKVSVLQRRLIAEKEAAAKQAATLEQKEDEIVKLKKALDIRMEGDVLQQELSHLRAQIQFKSKEQRAAKAEVASLQAELAARDKEGRKRDQGVLNALKDENTVAEPSYLASTAEL